MKTSAEPAPTLTATGPGAFSLAGPVTFATAGGLLESGAAAFARQAALTINLQDVTPVDSAGLALLLEWLRQARAEGRAMSFTGLPDKLLAIARLSGVEGLLTASYSAPASSSSASSSSASSSSASSR